MERSGNGRTNTSWGTICWWRRSPNQASPPGGSTCQWVIGSMRGAESTTWVRRQSNARFPSTKFRYTLEGVVRRICYRSLHRYAEAVGVNRPEFSGDSGCPDFDGAGFLD